MSETISKATALDFVDEALADVEAAIQAHPLETAEAYNEGAWAHRKGMATATETEWSRRVGLSLSDLEKIHRYLFAVSFMSAWWHLRGDKRRRDKAAQTACLLVTGVGIDLEEAMSHLLRYEQTWCGVMSSDGLARYRNAGCAGTILAVGALIGSLVELYGAV